MPVIRNAIDRFLWNRDRTMRWAPFFLLVIAMFSSMALLFGDWWPMLGAVGVISMAALTSITQLLIGAAAPDTD